MDMATEQNFLACMSDPSAREWLQSSLASLGQVIEVEERLEEMFRLVDVMNVAVVFIGVDQNRQVQQCALIESLVESCPMVAVVAVGEGFDSSPVIAAMRAGARDFISLGLRGSEVLGLVRRQLTRLPQLPLRSAQAGVSALYSAQGDVDAALVAAHLALKLAQDGHRVLLLDAGMPCGESRAMLDIECTFHFDDALRNLRRIDSSVIDSAFATVGDKLKVLPLNDEGFSLDRVNAAELFLLLGSLKQNFDQIVINLCGQGDNNLVRTMAGGADRLYWYTDQSISCSRRNLNLLQLWRSHGVKLSHAELIVDRYLDRIVPSGEALATTLDLPLAAQLPLNALMRLQCRNQGRSLYELAPRDSLSKALGALARKIAAPANNGKKAWWRLWK